MPSVWKLALIIPLPKIRNPKMPKDYRPISLLSTLGKVLERIMAVRITEYLITIKAITPHQFAFRPSLSSAVQVSVLVQRILDAWDNDMDVLSTSIDYEKAYDKVHTASVPSMVGIQRHSIFAGGFDSPAVFPSNLGMKNSVMKPQRPTKL